MPSDNEDARTKAGDQQDASARAESRIRDVGSVLLIGGAAAGFAIALAAWMYREIVHAPCPYEWVMYSLGACMVASITGLMERITRGFRRALRTILDNQAEILRRQTLIEETFGNLAAVMPKEHAKQWWRGAVENDPELAATGTEPLRRSEVLRLIRDDASAN